jgi:hypothetical protein
LELLLKRGVSIDFLDDAGYTGLMRSISGEDFDLTEWLLQKGAAATIEAPNGVTPANQLQRMIGRFKPGSETYIKLEHIKDLMVKQGVVFPALGPAEIRAKRAL